MPFVERKSKGTGAFFKWDVIGKEFTGQYVRLGKGEFKGRDTYHAVFIQSGTGQEVRVNAPTVLRRRLEEEFKPGATLYIKYTHDENGNNPQPAKVFAIFEWEPDQQAPAAVPTAQPPATPIPVPQVPLAPPVPTTPPAALPTAPGPVPAAIPLPAPAAPAAPAPGQSEYQTLLARLEQAAGQSYPLMVKMLDSYTTEAAKVDALKLTLRQTFGVQV